MPEALIIPLWGKIVLFSVAKKAAVLTAGYLYGVPRLYRRIHKLARWLAKDPQTRANLHGSVRAGFRIPSRLLHWDQKPRTLPSPALSYLQRLPIKLLPRQSNRLGPQQAAHTARFPRLHSLKTSFASSPFVVKHSQSWAAGREQLADLRMKCSYRYDFQAMRLRASSILSSKPFALVPAIAA